MMTTLNLESDQMLTRRSGKTNKRCQVPSLLAASHALVVTSFCTCIGSFQRLDRAWYDMDSGYDETQNPFADVSEEYTKAKEEKLVKKAVKRMSAQQRQINKVQ